MPDNEFRDKLVSQIKEKRQDKQKLEQQRFEIQSQLKALDEELRGLESALSVHDRLMGIASAPSSTPNSNARRFAKATIADSCAAIMREMGGYARIRDLVECLQKAGKLTSKDYRTAHSTVLKSLQRDKRFEHIERGAVALKETVS